MARSVAFWAVLAMVLTALIIGINASYSNPVEASTNLPDPGVFWDPVTKQYIAATTGGLFSLHTSPDLVTWKSQGSIFTPSTQPKWANGGFWAPEIQYVHSQKKYVAVFAAMNKADGHEKVGLATAKSVFGPWTDHGTPLFEQPGVLEIIDPSLFKDPKTGKYVLYWKTRGGGGTTIWARQMNGRVTNFAKGSKTHKLFANTLPWEGFTVEGPNVLYRKGHYYVFYSGNTCCLGLDSKYRVGVARSKSPFGPFTKRKQAILKESSVFVGPGHGTALRLAHNSKRTVFVYHAYVRGALANKYGDGRYLMLDEILWTASGWPHFRNSIPSSGPTPVPK